METNAIYKSEEGKKIIMDRYMELLPMWPVPYEYLTMPTCEGDTAVLACGDKQHPPLFLFHGSMSNSIMWISDVVEWSKYFRIYAVDMIGEAGMSAPSRPSHDSDAYAKWLDDVFAELGVENAAMVGISLGGWLVLDFGIRRPGKVNQMVVMCPAGVGKQKNSFFFKALFLMMMGQWGKDKLRQMVMGKSSGQSSDGLNIYMDFVSLIQKHFKPRVVRFSSFSDDMLKSLKMPVLGIVGKEDVFFDSMGTKSRLEQNLPDTNVIYHPDMGHIITGQTEVILKFLQEKGSK